MTTVTGRLNQRLQLLGEIERQSVDSQRSLRQLAGQATGAKDQLAATELS